MLITPGHLLTPTRSKNPHHVLSSPSSHPPGLGGSLTRLWLDQNSIGDPGAGAPASPMLSWSKSLLQPGRQGQTELPYRCCAPMFITPGHLLTPTRPKNPHHVLSSPSSHPPGLGGSLTRLWLDQNSIGDPGAGAPASPMLSWSKSLLQDNIGDAGAPAPGSPMLF